MKLLRLLLINLLVLGACFELAAFALSRTPAVRGRFFSMLPVFLERLEALPDLEQRYASFLADTYDAELGWLPRPSSTRPGTRCDDAAMTYRYDAAGARATPGGLPGPEVLVFGDSYTHGDEVDDADTYPWQLAELLGQRVVNYGVGGFGPLQATLRFERVAAQHPQARFAVLGVMTENIYRVVNAYRPVYHFETTGLFAFKPSLRGGTLRPNPNAPPAPNARALLPRVRAGFGDDWFSLPEPGFPYSLALLRGLRSNAVRLTLARRSDPLAAWRSPELRDALLATLERFVAAAEAHQLTPTIAWIPQAAHLRGALRELTRPYAAAFGERARFVAVAGGAVGEDEWAGYAEPGCHPTRAGYGIIARHVAQALRPEPRGAGPGRAGG